MPITYARATRCLALLAATATLGLGLGGCEDDVPLQGARTPCSHAGGSGLECVSEPIETAEDACWRLVDCGVIPLDEPDPDRNWVLDWERCLRTVAGMGEFQQTLVLRCVESSTCDQLKADSSPNAPSGGEEALPICLQYGDQ